jgi:hypothetical protein
LVHHLRKGDGQEATGARGSGALPAFVDVILELRRYDASVRQDRRRVLTGYSRWDDTPDELVVELVEDGTGYRAHGDKKQVAREEIRNGISRVLPLEPPGITSDAIREAWPSDPPPHNQKLLAELRWGVDEGFWGRQGKGKKGSPFTFWLKQRS